MNHRHTFFAVFALGAATFLTACGGGSGSVSSPTVAELTDSLVSRYNSGLSAMGTSTALAAGAVADSFDTAYLDAGFKKTDLLASLTLNAQTLGTNPELSLFPTSSVSKGVVSNCDANNICTFSGTLTNSDADSTSIDFTTKVKNVNGALYLYGDQSATTSI
jgi:hypothetical protein